MIPDLLRDSTDVFLEAIAASDSGEVLVIDNGGAGCDGRPEYCRT